MKSNTKIKNNIVPKNRIFFYLIIIIAIFFISGCEDYVEPVPNIPQISKVTISRIIDGDTYEMSDKTDIRVLCMDYPDISGNKPDGIPRIDFWLNLGLNESRVRECYESGKVLLNNLILNKEVALEYGKTKTDKYGRTLAYINYDGIDVGKYLIEQGYAVQAYSPCNRETEYKDIENNIRINKIGCLWKEDKI